MLSKRLTINKIRIFTDPFAEGLMRFLNGPYPIKVKPHLEKQLAGKEPSGFHIEYYKGAGEVFREQFAIRTVEYIIIVMFILGIFWLINTFRIGRIPLQIIGISINLLGAAVLGRGLLSGPIIITQQSMSGYGGYNPELRDSMLQDSVDGAWGIFFLIVGIIIQAISLF